MELANSSISRRSIPIRRTLNTIAKTAFFLSTLLAVVILGVLIIQIFSQGFQSLTVSFLINKLSTNVDKAGIMGAILGTVWLMAVVVPLTFVIGIGTALYLQFYVKDGKLKTFFQMNIANLAGVPSIVYGILGLTIFVRLLELGNVVLAGGLTMSLLIIPIMIITTQESLQAVPKHLSEASYGMGATKWQTIKHIILPAALPSILTGAILAFSRGIGETSPLVVLGIPALLIPFPGSILDKFTVLPMQIYYWTLDSSLVAEYANLAAATIVVLLVILLFLNIIAIVIRNKFQKRY